MVEDFDSFFSRATGHDEPYGWQREVARDGLPDLIAIPTGFGKTEGAVLPWLYRTRHLGVAAEGRRLIYTLPMRSLVRQTHERVQRWLERLSLSREVAVVALAGGSNEASSGDAARAWMERPEHPQIVIGTQDRLLSGALGRGYALSRFQWPVALGLLNADCHWVIDETQLMGPGLWTTAQLDWMRRLRFGAFGAARTTWMSATLARGFLQTVDRLPELPVSSLRTIELGEVPAHAKARRDSRRPIVPLGGDDPASPPQTAKKGKGATREAKAGKPKKGTGRLACSVDEVASAAWLSHRKATLTLVIANTVTRAQALYEALDRLARGGPNTAASPSTLLITSRMRGEDRAARETALYDFEAARRSGTLAPDHPGLICVATQVVEAGVDISAERLFSDLAPWPSIVQRLGRLNRDGSAAAPAATFYWSELPERGAERLGPYPVAALDLSQELLDLYGPLAAKKAGLDAVAELASNPKALKALEDTPRALVRARDVHGLFGNEADLRGGFVDVSPFVRDADPEVDVTVFWRAWRDDDRAPPPAESDGPPVAQAECCPVGIFALRKHLQEKKKRAWRWDDRRAAWVALDAGSVLPGMVVMLGSRVGGYDERLGWTGRTGTPLPNLAAPPAPEGDEDDPRVGDERGWVGLTQHLSETETEARRLVESLPLPEGCKRAVIDAARLHDLGKALPSWQEAIVRGMPGVATRLGPVAKSPALWLCRTPLPWSEEVLRSRLGLPEPTPIARLANGRWLVEVGVRPAGREVTATRAPFRPGLRHEAASALAMWRRYRTAETVPFSALAVYLAACHHGKVRTALSARGKDGLDVAGLRPGDHERLQLGGETWELDYEVADFGLSGTFTEEGFLPSTVGWSGLVAELLGDATGQGAPTGALRADDDASLSALGPFRLAYLEALVRAADVAASQLLTAGVSAKEVTHG